MEFLKPITIYKFIYKFTMKNVENIDIGFKVVRTAILHDVTFMK